MKGKKNRRIVFTFLYGFIQHQSSNITEGKKYDENPTRREFINLFAFEELFIRKTTNLLTLNASKVCEFGQIFLVVHGCMH